MSHEAKTVLTNRVESGLEDLLTVSTLKRVMAVLSDCLDHFDVEQLAVFTTETDDLLEVYINALQVEGRSPKTLDRYRYIITRMMQSVSIPTNEITVHHLRSYLSNEKARGVMDSTLDGVRQVFSAYFNWLQKEGLIIKNPTANLGPIKSQKKVKTIYSEVDIERLKINCDHVRNRAIVCFLLSTGCRVSEMVGLNISNVDLNNLECVVLGKGNKQRTVYMDSVTGMLIQEYLASRIDSNPALFISIRGQPQRFHAGGVRRMLKVLGMLAHVEHVHPHKFRRTQATRLIQHGMPIQEVAAILGHDKLDTTMEYVVMDKRTIKNSYQKYI